MRTPPTEISCNDFGRFLKKESLHTQKPHRGIVQRSDSEPITRVLQEASLRFSPPMPTIFLGCQAVQLYFSFLVV